MVFGLKGVAVSKELDVFETKKSAYLILSKIYHENDQDKKAFEYQTEYIALSEKNTKENFKKGLGVLRSEMKFKNQKKLLIE